MQLKLRIALAFLTAYTSLQLSAQNDFSILYLQNGSVYVGEVLSDEGYEIDMKLADGNAVTFPMMDVRRHLTADRIVVYPDGKYHSTRGFFFHTGLGMNFESLVIEAEEGRISSHVPYLFGFYLNKKWALGGGFGIEFNEAEVSGFEFDTQFSSQFLYARHYPFDIKRRPFAYARIGYGGRSDESEFDDDHSGGFQFQAGGGIHFASRRKSKFVLSLGYHIQKTDGTERFIDQFGSEINADYDILIRRLILTFGIEFNKVPKRYQGAKK